MTNPIAQVCDDLFTQQFNRWSHLLKAGEQAKQFNETTRDGAGDRNRPHSPAMGDGE